MNQFQFKPIWVYIVKCADGSYYTGSYRGEDLDVRIAEHDDGIYTKSYTYKRRPVTLVWSELFERADDAIESERGIKGWSRRKKEALINGEFDLLPKLSKRGPANKGI